LIRLNITLSFIFRLSTFGRGLAMTGAVRRPAIPQALLQCPQQRGADHRVVLRLRAVADMPLCQCAGDRQNLFEIGKTFHHPSQHCHQLAALLDHIVGKHRLHLRGDVEQTIIKQHGRGFRVSATLAKLS
jgi:hypothetical protein